MFAELYDAFDDVLQKGYRAGVIIGVASLLMLAIQVVQQIQKRRAHARGGRKILKESELMIEDVQRLRDRVDNLISTSALSARHREIVTSAEKILTRARDQGRRVRRRPADRADHTGADGAQARMASDRARRCAAPVLPRRPWRSISSRAC